MSAQRRVTITPPLGAALQLGQFIGSEERSSLFSFDVDMVSDCNGQHTLVFADDIVGSYPPLPGGASNENVPSTSPTNHLHHLVSNSGGQLRLRRTVPVG